MTTRFVSERLELWDGLEFRLDGNSKITCRDGTFLAPAPNSFSLPHIAYCPGSTPTCRESCYVNGLLKSSPDTYIGYLHNARALSAILGDPRSERAAAERLAARIRVFRNFRWHVSGDVGGDEHARWIARICGLAPDTAFWIYTRTLDAVPDLARVPNLALNLSADAHNYARCRLWSIHARITYLTDGAVPTDLPPGSVIFPDYGLRGDGAWLDGLGPERRGMVCPADFFGQNEGRRCGICKKCLA